MGANKHVPTGAEKQAAKQQKAQGLTLRAIAKAVKLNGGRVICASRDRTINIKAARLIDAAPTMPKSVTGSSLVQQMEHLNALMELPLLPPTTMVVFACHRSEMSQMQLDMLQTFAANRHYFLPV
jgi:hypothetical protein